MYSKEICPKLNDVCIVRGTVTFVVKRAVAYNQGLKCQQIAASPNLSFVIPVSPCFRISLKRVLVSQEHAATSSSADFQQPF